MIEATATLLTPLRKPHYLRHNSNILAIRRAFGEDVTGGFSIVGRLGAHPSLPQQEVESPDDLDSILRLSDIAFLYGESVIALLELALTDPTKMWIGVKKRTRRNLGDNVRIVQEENIIPVWIEGIPCQPIADAIVSASATMGHERAAEAAGEALRLGYLSKTELVAIEGELIK